MKKLKHLCSYLIIGSLVLSSVIISPKKADASSVNLATFSFSKSDGASTAKDLNDTYGTKADSGYSPKSGLMTSSKLYACVDATKTDYRKLEWSGDTSYTYINSTTSMPIMAAGTKNPWGNTAYFMVKTSTKGYENINFSFLLGGSKKGPKDFKLQYSVDGKSFGNISDTSMSLHTNKKMYSYSYDLPTLANKDTLYIRIVTSSTGTIEGGSFTSVPTSGETAINNIILKGSELSKATPTPKPTAKPTAKPTTGNDSNNTSSKDNNNSDNTVNNPTQNTDNTDNTNNTSDKTVATKRLAKPTLTSYKSGKNVIKGKTVKKAKVTVKIGKKSYSVTAGKKGTFKIKLSQKLKKGQIIKVYASKKNFKNSKTKKYTVK